MSMVLYKENWLSVTGPVSQTTPAEDIGGARVWATMAFTDNNASTYNCRLQGSLDGILWRNLFTIQPTTSSGNTGFVDLELGPYRYLRLELVDLPAGASFSVSVMAVTA